MAGGGQLLGEGRQTNPGTFLFIDDSAPFGNFRFPDLGNQFAIADSKKKRKIMGKLSPLNVNSQ